MRDKLVFTMAATAAIAAISPTAAGAQATRDASLKVTPANGGSARQPQGHKVEARIDVGGSAAVTGFELWYGRSFVFRREGVPACSAAVLRVSGPAGCPAESIMGVGRASEDPSDETSPSTRFVWVNAPGGKLSAYVTLQRPARVRAPLQPSVFDNPRSAWPHRDAWRIPPSLRTIAGIPISMPHLALSFGGKSWARDYIATTGCPKGGWRWRIRVHTDRAGVLDREGRAPCHR